MSFHFSDAPDQVVVANMQKLASLEEAQVKDFTQSMLNFLSSGNPDQLNEGLRNFSQQYGVPVGGLQTLARPYILFLKGAYQNNLSATQISEDLNRFGWPQPSTAVVAVLWKRASSDLSTSSLGETLMVNKLVLPEWRFGITASNKELKDVGSTFLQLKLVLDRGDGETRDEYVELSLPQFYEFVATMEKAKAQMDFFS